MRILETAIKHGDGNYFLPDFNKKAIISMIVALDALGIKKLWEPGKIFHENHPTILQIFNFAKQNQWTLATIGLDFKKCEAPIQLVQGILQRLGLKMPRLKRS